jgi:L-methionine (R)-S-oxide reductase
MTCETKISASDEAKQQAYATVLAQAQALVEGVDNRVGALANLCALLKESFAHYFWVGFYVVEGDTLHLGPFQGPVACYAIGKGRGVCGSAWEQGQTLVVPDVEQFPGHIACSSRSRSEIVVPVFKGGRVAAVIDVDSESLSAFDSVDKEGLERLALLCAPFV